MALQPFAVEFGVELENGLYVIDFTVDPTSVGVAAPIGSVGLRDNGDTYHKTGAGDTDWTKLMDVNTISLEDGYQNAYMGKPISGNVLPIYSSNNHITDSDSLLTAISDLDSYIGADPTANSRTNNPIIVSDQVNANIEHLDDAIGSDSDVTNTNYITLDSTLMKKASDLDGALKTHVDDTTNPHQVTLEQARSQDNVLAGDVDMNNAGTIINVPDPINEQDAVNKRYVDGLVDGVRWKEPVKASTTAGLPSYTYNNGTSGVGATLTATSNGALPAQDGITLSQDDRLLVKDESGGNVPYNGIYEVTQVGDGSNPWILTRTEDFDESDEVVSAAVLIAEGTSYADTGWTCTTDEPVTIGTTNITWVEFTRLGQINAGAGLFKSAPNTIDVGDVNKGVQVNANDVEIDASEIAGDGLKQNGSSSYVLDIEPADFAGNGLEDDGSDNLQIKAGDDGSANLADVVSVQSDGISVKVDEVTIQENGSSQLEVIGYWRVKADNQNATGTITADQISVSNVASVQWQLVVYENASPTAREAMVIYAANDGSTNVDWSRYAKQKFGSGVSGLDVDVDVSGGNMRLRITANNNINYRVTRIVQDA